MKNRKEAIAMIQQEVFQDNPEVRERFVKEFKPQLDEFVENMADSLLRWNDFNNYIGQSERLGYASGFIYSAIWLNILSMKLLVSGHIVAAGNLMRQVLESIAMSLLCSSTSIGVHDKFIQGQYKTCKALPDLEKHSEKLNIYKGAVDDLIASRDWYHQYSHPTKLTLASFISFETEGGLYVGCAFDEGKIEAYKSEVNGRVELTKTFASFIDAVSFNSRKQLS